MQWLHMKGLCDDDTGSGKWLDLPLLSLMPLEASSQCVYAKSVCVCVSIRLHALLRIKPYKKPLQLAMPFCSACISQVKMPYSRGLRLLPLRPTLLGASTLQGIVWLHTDRFPACDAVLANDTHVHQESGHCVGRPQSNHRETWFTRAMQHGHIG